MPDPRRKWCKGGCGRHASECGPISWSGLCLDCALERQASNIAQMHTLSGPNVVRWRRRVVARVTEIAPLPTLDVANAARQASHLSHE